MKFSKSSKVDFLFLILLAFTISGCSTTAKNKNVQNDEYRDSSLYCDSFMTYTMCAEDLTGNGEVDLFFFEDDDQIFFYRQGFLRKAISSHLFHPCKQQMEEGLVRAGSKLLLINREENFVQRISLQTKLMAFYISYLPVINSCQEAGERGNDSTNSFDYDEYF